MICAAIAAALSFTSCYEIDDWNYGDPSQDNVYFIHFDWGQTTNDFNKNAVKYTVNQGSVVDIPMQFQSAFTRDYDVETYYYIVSDLKAGTDYQVVDESGNALSPASDGAYTLLWPNAVKGIQNVRIKALNGATGSLKVQSVSADHIKPDAQDISTLIQHEEADYTVRIVSTNYFVTVTIK